MFLEKMYHASTKSSEDLGEFQFSLNTGHVRRKNNIPECTVGSIAQEKRGESKVLFTGGKQLISICWLRGVWVEYLT